MHRKRRKSRDKTPKKNQRKTLVICVEGDTEDNYIKYLNAVYKTGHKIKYEKKSKFTNDSKTYISKIMLKYGVDKDELILIYDLENSLTEYKKFVFNNELIHKKTYLVQPCIEYHFLLHHKAFSDATNRYRDCEDVENELKEYLPNYRKGNSFSWSSNNIDRNKIELAKTRSINGFKSLNQKSLSMLGKFIEDSFVN